VATEASTKGARLRVSYDGWINVPVRVRYAYVILPYRAMARIFGQPFIKRFALYAFGPLSVLSVLSVRL